jgi:hypothetical protein
MITIWRPLDGSPSDKFLFPALFSHVGDLTSWPLKRVSYLRDANADRDYAVFCFAEHADAFCSRFGANRIAG